MSRTSRPARAAKGSRAATAKPERARDAGAIDQGETTEVAGGDDRAEALEADKVEDGRTSGGVNAADARLTALLDADGRQVAALVAARAGSREARGRARGALAAAFAAQAEDPAIQLAALAALGRVLRELEGGALAGLRPIGQVAIRRPLPEFFIRPRAAAGARALGAAVAGHFSVPLALSEARLDFFEARCRISAPGLLRTHKQHEGEGDKLVGGDAELLRKRGRSPFS